MPITKYHISAQIFAMEQIMLPPLRLPKNEKIRTSGKASKVNKANQNKA